MKKDKGKKVINSRCSYQVYFCLVLILVILNLSVEGCAKMDGSEDYVRYISFSPDSKKILFDRRNYLKGEISSRIHSYDLESGELSAYEPVVGEHWGLARYSFNGGKIVFKTQPFVDGMYDPANTQIAIMDVDGKNVRKITSSPGFKASPSFSHSDKKIIFCKAALRESGRTPAAGYDVYEVDIETGKEIRLTWFKFFEMSAPYYYPDDKTIIFSAIGAPSLFPGIAEDDFKTIQKKQKELEAKSQQAFGRLDDNIYVMKKGQKELPEPLIKSKDGLRSPLLTAKGLLFFETQAYKPDGKGDWSQYFAYSPDGKYCRITNVSKTSIWAGAVSPDGKLLAVVCGGEIMRIVIYRIQDGTSREISLPDQPSRIINAPKQTKKVLNVI